MKYNVFSNIGGKLPIFTTDDPLILKDFIFLSEYNNLIGEKYIIEEVDDEIR